MKINILLPYKENFDLLKASSVSITVKNNITHSHFKKNINIFGKSVENPLFPQNFIGLESKYLFLQSKNKYLARKMCEFIIKGNEKKNLIEIHNRPYLYKLVRKKIKNIPVLLFFHNDPLEMLGSKTLKERMFLLSETAGIVCVSQYIKDKFLEGITLNHEKVYVLHNGVDRKIKLFPIKNKEVLYVGRIVKEKGIDLFVNTITKISPQFDNWKFCICGSSKLGDDFEKSKFALEIEKKIKNIGKKVTFLGYINNDEVQKRMQKAAIIVAPSVWPEPFGLVVAEGMSNGCAILTSNVGGIKEIVKNNGIVIENITEKKLEKHLVELISNNKLLSCYQKKAWENFNHSSLNSSKKLDDIRTLILKKYQFIL